MQTCQVYWFVPNRLLVFVTPSTGLLGGRTFLPVFVIRIDLVFRHFIFIFQLDILKRTYKVKITAKLKNCSIIAKKHGYKHAKACGYVAQPFHKLVSWQWRLETKLYYCQAVSPITYAQPRLPKCAPHDVFILYNLLMTAFPQILGKPPLGIVGLHLSVCSYNKW